MPGPTDPNDPQYANDPHYVFSGGRWQYTNTPGGSSAPAPGGGNTVTGDPIASKTIFGDVTFDPTARAANTLNSSGFPSQIAGADFWGPAAAAAANAPELANPYNAAAANQARPGQQQALQALMGMMGGPGVTGLAGNAAMGGALQQSLQGMSNVRGNQQGQMMGQAAQGMGGMANDVGQSRLQEYMQMAHGVGQGLGGMRGQDLGAMEGQLNAGLGAREISDTGRLAAAGQGANLSLAASQLASDRYKAMMQAKMNYDAQNQQTGQNAAQAGGTILSLIMQLMGKGGG